MRLPAAVIVLSLIGCRSDYAIEVVEPEPVSLTVTSPEYGVFLGEDAALVTGVVSPPQTLVVVQDVAVTPEEDGSFSALVPVEGPYEIIEVLAVDQRVRVPVFSGHDPQDTWPGGISARLLPAGLDRLGEELGALIDATGWADALASSLPALEGDGYAVTPVGISYAPTVVALTGVDGGIDTVITLDDVGVDYLLAAEVFGYAFEADVSVYFGQIGIGAVAIPSLDDDRMLSLALTDTTLALDDPDIEIGALEGWLLEWAIELVTDWVLEPLTELVLDYVLDSWGTIELGGPLAFATDLMGTAINLEVAEVGGDEEGVRAGLAVGIGEDVDADFSVTVPSADDSQAHLAIGLHEGLLDTILSGELLSMLQQDIELSGSFGEIIGAGVAALPGGEDAPDGDGWCLSLDPGPATVVRLQEHTAPLAVLYIPDLQVDIGIEQGAVCETWLAASLAMEVGLNVEDGAVLGIDLAVPEGAVLAYGAEDWDEDEVVAALSSWLGTIVSLIGGVAEIDLGSLLSGVSVVDGLSPMSPAITGSAVLYDEDGQWTEGLYSVSMTLWE